MLTWRSDSRMTAEEHRDLAIRELNLAGQLAARPELHSPIAVPLSSPAASRIHVQGRMSLWLFPPQWTVSLGRLHHEE